MVIMAMTETERALVVAIIGGAVALVVAIIGALAGYFAGKRQQRRVTYSEAVKAATAWKELLYRVRRRRDNADEVIELTHVAQESLAYYEAWVGAESKYMARSFKRLVTSVKAKTESLIQEAWKQGVRPVPGDASPEDAHPDVDADVEAFLKDVRSHLSPWPWRKLAVVWRNREGA